MVRRGDEWGGLGRAWDIPLDFLGAGTWKSVSDRDTKDKPDAWDRKDGSITRGEHITVDIPARGGFVGVVSAGHTFPLLRNHDLLDFQQSRRREDLTEPTRVAPGEHISCRLLGRHYQVEGNSFTVQKLHREEVCTMKISRRKALSVIAGARVAPLSRKSFTQPSGVALEIAPGPFKGTRESLREWQVPDWYRDAKFGIWAHWGPQSAVEYGDWYARNMYVQGNKQYEYHLKTYGHPTKVGLQGSDSEMDG